MFICSAYETVCSSAFVKENEVVTLSYQCDLIQDKDPDCSKVMG